MTKIELKKWKKSGYDKNFLKNIVLKGERIIQMETVKITYEELQKWKSTRYDNSFIKNILAKYLNVKVNQIDDYEQVNWGLTFNVWLIEVEE
jgi:butyrate kinase